MLTDRAHFLDDTDLDQSLRRTGMQTLVRNRTDRFAAYLDPSTDAPVKRMVITSNRILLSLSLDDQALLADHLEPAAYILGERLQSQNHRIDYVHFLEAGLASVVGICGEHRKQAEVAMVGAEGIIGLPILYGLERSPWDVRMQFKGRGQRIAARQLVELLALSGTLQSALLRYAGGFAVELSYNALANALMDLPARLARWLLLAQDRTGAKVLAITHERLGYTLGYRRAGITNAVQQFVHDGLVAHPGRGTLCITNRAGLLKAAAPFYSHAEAGRIDPGHGRA